MGLETVFQLVSSMLGDRFRSHTCRKKSGEVRSQGCLQCSILLPLLWSLVVDQFIEKIH
jgi:hypothetical protein